MANKTKCIYFETIDKICDVLDCEPGDILVRKNVRKKVEKNEQIDKAI